MEKIFESFYDSVNENVASAAIGAVKKLLPRNKISDILGKLYYDARMEYYKIDQMSKEYEQNKRNFTEDRVKINKNKANIKNADEKARKLQLKIDKLNDRIEITKDRKTQLADKAKNHLNQAKTLATKHKLTKFYDEKLYVVDTNILRARIDLIEDPGERKKLLDTIKNRVSKLKN